MRQLVQISKSSDSVLRSHQRYVKRSDCESCQFEHVGNCHLYEAVDLRATIWPILITFHLLTNTTLLYTDYEMITAQGYMKITP